MWHSIQEQVPEEFAMRQAIKELEDKVYEFEERIKRNEEVKGGIKNVWFNDI